MPKCSLADTPWARIRGLLGQKSLPIGQGLWIVPCSSIHTFFMAFAIDAVFFNRSGQVVAVYHQLAPWRLSAIHWSAYGVLELAAGEAQRLDIKKGEVLRLCKED